MLRAQERDTIIIKGDSFFAPYEFINEKGEVDGFNVDLFNLIMSKTNLPYVITLEDWNKVVDEYKEKQIDVITGISIRGRNRDWLQDDDFGIPFFRININIVSRKNNKFTTQQEIRNKRIAVQNSSSSEWYINQYKLSDKIIYTSDLEKAFILLTHNEVDAVLCDDIIANYFIQKGKFKGLYVSKNSLFQGEYSFAVNGDPKLRQILNRGLYEAQTSGELKKIYNKWISPYDKDYDKIYSFRIIFFLLSITLFFLLIILVLNIRVKSASKRLSISKKDLDTKNSQLKLVLKAGNIIPLEWNIKNDFVNIAYNEYMGSLKNLKVPNEGFPLSSILENIHPDDKENITTIYNSIQSGNKNNAQFICRYDNRKQYEHYYEVYLSVNSKINNAPVSAVGYIQDITERHTNELKLKENEQFLTQILNDMPFPIYVTDVKNNFSYKYWNRQSTIQFEVDATGRDTFTFLDFEKGTLVQKIDQEIYLTGKEYNSYDTVVLKSGRTLHNLVQKNRITIGNEQYIITIRQNLNELVRLKNDIEKINRQNELILHNINSGIIFISPTYVVKWQNIPDNFPNILKKIYSHGTKCYRNNKNYQPCAGCLVENAMATRTVCYGEFSFDKDTYLKFTAIPVFNFEETPEGVVLKIEDISEMKKINLQLIHAKDKAEEADKLKSAFIANMSHEIRTPLNSIMGFSQLICDSTNREEQREFSTIISNNSNLLMRILNDILDLSKIEAGYVLLKKYDFDISALYNSLFASFQNRMHNDVTLKLEVPIASYNINWDKNRMTQILTNFLTNAIKFTPKGSITLGFTILDDGSIKIYVKDTGIGIDNKLKDRVFGRFEKFNEDAQGTGLGLSICKSLIDVSNGEISFDSEVGKGSTFWAIIPAASLREGIGQISSN